MKSGLRQSQEVCPSIYVAIKYECHLEKRTQVKAKMKPITKYTYLQEIALFQDKPEDRWNMSTNSEQGLDSSRWGVTIGKGRTFQDFEKCLDGDS